MGLTITHYKSAVGLFFALYTSKNSKILLFWVAEVERKEAGPFEVEKADLILLLCLFVSVYCCLSLFWMRIVSSS